MNNLLEDYEKAETRAERKQILKQMESLPEEERRQLLHGVIDKLVDLFIEIKKEVK